MPQLVSVFTVDDMSANYKTRHDEYNRLLPAVKKVRSCVDGTVKDYRGTYLPAPFELSDPDRYDSYLERAYYLNATGQAEKQTVGMVFRRPASVLELTPSIEQYQDNADGTGQSIQQVSKKLVSELEQTPQVAVLTDYTRTDGVETKADEMEQGARPYLAVYPFESLINWDYKTVNGRKVLVMAVLAEMVDTSDDEFTHNYDYQYRVLRLQGGQYTQQIYDANGEAGEKLTPLASGGVALDYIPLRIAYPTDNAPKDKIPRPPLEPLANVNLAHYQVTADHMENLFIHGQVTLGISTKLDFAQFSEANKNGIQVGARTGHFLGEGGQFVTATAPESSSLSNARKDLEQEMVYLGAKLIQRGGQAQTAQASRIDADAETSVLDGIVKNVSEAMELALQDMARFAGDNPDDVKYQLSTDFIDASITAQDAAAITGLVEKQIIAADDARDMIRRGRVDIPQSRTNEDIQGDIANGLIDNLNED